MADISIWQKTGHFYFALTLGRLLYASLPERRQNGYERRCGQDVYHNVLANGATRGFRRTVNDLFFGKPRRGHSHLQGTTVWKLNV